MKKTAYIAGPVSGQDIEEVKKIFEAKRSELRGAGYDVINPLEKVEEQNDFIRRINCYKLCGEQYALLNDAENRHLTLRHCIGLLVRCDEIHLLPNWQFSEGAQIEHKIAELLKIKIVYPGDDLENLK